MSLISGSSQYSIVIPDLHGCFQYLEWVLERFPDRSLIFLGDLIHRGPDSKKTLQTTLELAESGRAVFLWGNHEHWVYRDLKNLSLEGARAYCDHEDPALLQSYEGDYAALLEDFLVRLPRVARPFWVEGPMLCAHAACPSFGSSADQLLDEGYLWDTPEMGLHPLPLELFPDLRYSVHGHTPQVEPWVDLEGQGVIYLDLGAYRTGNFCVWDAEEARVVMFGD